MVIGALVVPREDKDQIEKNIKKLKKQHNFYQEIKWNKVGEKFDKLLQAVNILFYHK